MTDLKKLAEEIHKNALPHNMAEGGLWNPKTTDHRYAIHINCLTCEQKEPIINFIQEKLQKVRNETIEECAKVVSNDNTKDMFGMPTPETMILALKTKESK